MLAFFTFFGSIADLGLYAIATREISRENAPESDIIGKIFTLRILISSLVFLLSPLVFLLPYPREVQWGILISAGAFVFSSGYLVLNGVFQKNLAMDKVSLVELLGKAIQTAIIVLAVYKNWGFTAIIASLFFYMIFNFFAVWWLSHRYIIFKLHVDWQYWKHFIRESWPMGMSVIITFVYFKLDTILLSLMKSSADVGIYNAAYKVIENITFFPAMIIGLIFPLMSRYIFSDRAQFENIANKTFKIFVILVVPLIIGMSFLAPEIIRLIGGAGFTESASVLRVLTFALGFIFFGNFFNNVLIAGNAQKSLMKALLFCAIINVTANLIIIPLFSYQGAAITSVITEFLVVVVTAYLVAKKMNYIPHLYYWRKVTLSAILMIAFLAGAKAIHLFPSDQPLAAVTVHFLVNFLVLVIGSSGIYFVALYATNAIQKEELVSILSRKS